MAMIPMKKIHQARRRILNGESVKSVSKALKMSESTVYAYTKAERAKMKGADRT